MLLTEIYQDTDAAQRLAQQLETRRHVTLRGVTGSLDAVLMAAVAQRMGASSHLVIAAGREEAYYLANDMETLLDDADAELEHKRVLLFPATRRRERDAEADASNVLMRSEAVKQLNSARPLVIVTYPEALAETVVSARSLASQTLQLGKGAKVDMDFAVDVLNEYGFERADFVTGPGQYAVRGGIIDVFSYGSDNPYRIEFRDEAIESLRTFSPVSQLSIRQYDTVSIIPNLEQPREAHRREEERVSLLRYFGSRDVAWAQGLALTLGAGQPSEAAEETLAELRKLRLVEMGAAALFPDDEAMEQRSERQPLFNKQFDMLIGSLSNYLGQGYRCFVSTTSPQQKKRLDRIFAEFPTGEGAQGLPRHEEVGFLPQSLRAGFIDHEARVLVYTDHEIFERYHKYTVRSLKGNSEALTMKELLELKPGDYVTHIDFGVGQFAGLEKIENGGRQQEVIRLSYKGGDTLYISIHSLHKISRYVGQEGAAPSLDKLGSKRWELLKQKTKKRVKDIAKDLIALYAKRKASHGFAFGPDTYLQNELEASFLYEDTPDQLKATQEVKRDMESGAPMDRLVCGDVGFGKTEVAMRAAFKAVCDSKQVAVLVPSTILAFQHYNTFRERLKGLPVNIDYLNRFRSTADRKRILAQLESGQLDILIGTHAITGKEVRFHDLGLLIVDEEQKFGVGMKERLRQMKVSVDCLTLTATPIPRTLQFSLMGARALSIIQTPPPNRQPVETELCLFSEAVIRDAVRFEMSRGGQTFLISNRVENLPEMAALVARLCPEAKVAVAHGQMEGKEVEDTLMRFLEGEVDVLVATTIIENGLDMPNANTMIINNAQHFGLSDLHQMRGRVGRSNRKAFCYMMVPSFDVMTDEAKKRLRAISEFSAIGSGFNIAMRDLDIRGAGNILGAEQSGFIADIGYEAYHKILNEAIEELKATDFRDLFAPRANGGGEYVRECQVETDLSVLLPDAYVASVSERLSLYKELNGLSTEEQLLAYRQRLVDRFGPVPPETDELIKTITLRRTAKEFGIEKVVLKQGVMLCYFATGRDNPFYQSANFNLMISFASSHPGQVLLKEQTDRLCLRCEKVRSIGDALRVLREMAA